MPLHKVWEYRDIGRLFITVGGEESDNRGAEVGLWVEVILRVSLEVILRKLLRQTTRQTAEDLLQLKLMADEVLTARQRRRKAHGGGTGDLRTGRANAGR